MKKKIAILGSTGSIGQTLLRIIKKDKNNFKIILLTANKNYKKLLQQSKLFKVNNLIIINNDSFKKLKLLTKNTNINVYNDFSSFNKIFKNKIDYVMSSITGIEGLLPTIEIIKFTKKIAIANKESIICGWNIILKELKKNKTNFIPVDSEHFSIWYALKNIPSNQIKNIYLTASGGPLLRIKKSKLKNIKISEVLKHPNWKMGKKITVDSSTLMNKVFEIIEAKNIFNIPYKKLSILIHPYSYIHAIINFNNGLSKLISHDTTMDIPIFNSLYSDTNKFISSKKIDIKKLNNLDLMKVDVQKFPSTKILKILPNKLTLFDTVIVSANDEFVKLYLQKKIGYTDIIKGLFKITNQVDFKRYKKIYPHKISDILNLNEYVRFKINTMSI